MTTLTIEGEMIEVGNLEGIDEPGFRIREKGGNDVVIYGLDRVHCSMVGNNIFRNVTLKIEIEIES